MHDIELILTLTAGLAVALILGYATNRIGLSPIVGYLLAGVVVGPSTPGFVANTHLATQLAEVGVILLMFGVGLHFHFHDLLAVKRIAIPGAIFQSLSATALGVVVAQYLGWGFGAGIVFGLSISVASTVVLTRVLADNNELHTPTGHIAVGWLVVEDIFTVLVLVALPAMFVGGEFRTEGLSTALLIAGLKICALVVFAVVVGGRVIPWVLARVAESRSRELFTLTVLVAALGIAVGSAIVFGVSMALGAFIAGMIVGRSDFSLRAASEALPMRDAFAVLFFVSAGMLFEPARMLTQPVAVLLTLGIIMIAKPLAAVLIAAMFRYPIKVSLAVAVALAQVGEFSFILAALGQQLGLLTPDITNNLVAGAIISISLNPLLFRLVNPIGEWISSKPVLKRLLDPNPIATTDRSGHDPHTIHPQHREPAYRAVVIGYGPVGRTLSRLLRKNGVMPTIVELNPETVRSLRDAGFDAVYGDAGRRETLEGAGVARAGTLILSASSIEGAEQVIHLARELNPRVRILVRSAYLRDGATLRNAGARFVFSGEGEVALAMTESVLRELGATAEQIDHERERVRADLFTDTAEASA